MVDDVGAVTQLSPRNERRRPEHVAVELFTVSARPFGRAPSSAPNTSSSSRVFRRAVHDLIGVRP